MQGGGWKGLYTLGVLDCLMQNNINLSSVVGCSAGAMSAVGYVAGQIGWGAMINLTYRHDPNYCGVGALVRDGGCAEIIPLGWAESSGEEKKVVVLTRELSFRRKPGFPKLAGVIYKNYPHLL